MNFESTSGFYSHLTLPTLVFQADVFSISLDNGTVVMDVKGIKVKSADKQYHDGLSHFVVTAISATRYRPLTSCTSRHNPCLQGLLLTVQLWFLGYIVASLVLQREMEVTAGYLLLKRMLLIFKRYQ